MSAKGVDFSVTTESAYTTMIAVTAMRTVPMALMKGAVVRNKQKQNKQKPKKLTERITFSFYMDKKI